ncbi:MAG: hypothetical protein R3A44_07190 [Caldilineaceae bacterium]
MKRQVTVATFAKRFCRNRAAIAPTLSAMLHRLMPVKLSTLMYGQFQPVDANDEPVHNLIALLGWNDPDLAEYRSKFVQRLKHTRALAFQDDDSGFLEYLKSDPENLSFISVLAVELGLSLGDCTV